MCDVVNNNNKKKKGAHGVSFKNKEIIHVYRNTNRMPFYKSYKRLELYFQIHEESLNHNLFRNLFYKLVYKDSNAHKIVLCGTYNFIKYKNTNKCFRSAL